MIAKIEKRKNSSPMNTRYPHSHSKSSMKKLIEIWTLPKIREIPTGEAFPTKHSVGEAAKGLKKVT